MSGLPRLEPSQEYDDAVLSQYPQNELNKYQFQREELLKDIEARRKGNRPRVSAMEVENVGAPLVLEDVPIIPNTRPILPIGHSSIAARYDRPIGPALPTEIIASRELDKYRGVLERKALQPGRGTLRLAGDKKELIVGYKANSLCSMLVQDCLQRAYLAMQLLDDTHAAIIRARLAKAGVKNANASHADTKEITYKKAVSIALQAEKWVYEAQAAAAKSMVKESKHCLHALAGKRRRTTEEKSAAYEKRYGGPRGTRTERAIKKYERKAQKLREGQ